MLGIAWGYIVLFVGSIVAAVTGWIKFYILTKQLREANQNNVLLDVARMGSEAELRAALKKDQLLHEQESKLRLKEIEVQNDSLSNPVDNLNGAIEGK
jgi:hypothetical protein